MADHLHIDLGELSASQAPSAQRARDSLVERIDSGEIGFADLPLTDEYLAACTEALAGMPSSDTLVVIGIGGSSLGGQAVLSAVAKHSNVVFLDNVDPHTIASRVSGLDLRRTIWNVVTKSGGTLETISTFLWAYERVAAAIGKEEAKQHFVFTTDPQNGSLLKLAQQWQMKTLPIPENVGGRFSVLTPVGFLPALYSGVDVRQFLGGARTFAQKYHPRHKAKNDPALALASGLVEQLQNHDRNQLVMFPYCDRLGVLGAWFVQLWAESLGKKNASGQAVGSTPIVARGATDQHSQLQLYAEGPDDKTFLFLFVEDNEPLRVPQETLLDEFSYLAGQRFSRILKVEGRGTRGALQETKRPTASIDLTMTPAAIGALLYMLELTTAYAGIMIDINPFDQPGVELSKNLAKAELRGEGQADATCHFHVEL